MDDRKQVPFGKLRAGSYRAYRPIRNDIDFCYSIGFSSLDFLCGVKLDGY